MFKIDSLNYLEIWKNHYTNHLQIRICVYILNKYSFKAYYHHVYAISDDLYNRTSIKDKLRITAYNTD